MHCRDRLSKERILLEGPVLVDWHFVKRKKANQKRLLSASD